MAKPAGTAVKSSANVARGAARQLSTKGEGVLTDDELIVYVDGMRKLRSKETALKDEISTYRSQWKGRGVELQLMDRRMKRSDWTPQEIQTDWETERRYAEVLGQPIGKQLEVYGSDATPDAIREQIRWRAHGRMHGLSGKGDAAEPPEGCPPECQGPYGEGWVEGQGEAQAVFLRSSGRKPSEKPN